MSKTHLKPRAHEMRRQGYSILQIAKELDITRGTASVWCSDIALTPEQIRTLEEHSRIGHLIGSETIRRKRQEKQKQKQEEGIQEIGNISQRELLLVGAALYWGEGTKKGRVFQISNSEAGMIKIIFQWLKIMKVPREKIKVMLQIHEAQDQGEMEKYWQEVVGKDIKFYKTQIDRRPKKGKSYSYYKGTLNVTVNSVELFYKVEGFILGLQRSIIA